MSAERHQTGRRFDERVGVRKAEALRLFSGRRIGAEVDRRPALLVGVDLDQHPPGGRKKAETGPRLGKQSKQAALELAQRLWVLVFPFELQAARILRRQGRFKPVV